MSSFRKIFGLLGIAALLVGCSAVRNFTNGFHAGFDTSFKACLVKACVAKGVTQARCVCVERRLTAEFSDEQFIKMKATGQGPTKAINDALRACGG
jgi:hypothetical protein